MQWWCYHKLRSHIDWNWCQESLVNGAWDFGIFYIGVLDVFLSLEPSSNAGNSLPAQQKVRHRTHLEHILQIWNLGSKCHPVNIAIVHHWIGRYSLWSWSPCCHLFISPNFHCDLSKILPWTAANVQSSICCSGSHSLELSTALNCFQTPFIGVLSSLNSVDA